MPRSLARGRAGMAGVACGLLLSCSECHAEWRSPTTFEPRIHIEPGSVLFYHWHDPSTPPPGPLLVPREGPPGPLLRMGRAETPSTRLAQWATEAGTKGPSAPRGQR